MTAAFTTLTSLVVPLDRANVNTDAIIPKQFMKSISRHGFGDFLFDEWRYLDQGELGQDCSKRPKNPDFSLNLDCYQGAQVLLGRQNFGCGSSREHAVWALHDYGIRAIIAPSFADIFYSNCIKNGLLPIRLTTGEVDRLFDEVHVIPGFSVAIDLPSQELTSGSGKTFSFPIEADAKRRLERGLDDIAITLEYKDLIREVELRRRILEPWTFPQK